MWERKFKMKVCLLGDGGVGKTSLVRRFVFNEFDERYLYTLGTNVSKKDVVLQGEQKGEVRASLMIWDIMGQRTFMPLLAESYFDGADGAIAVCDITRMETLDGLEGWMTSLREVAGDVSLVILANKSDLVEDTEAVERDVARVAREFRCRHYLTSAKTGRHVEDVFRHIAFKVLAAARLDAFGGSLPLWSGTPTS